MSKVEKGVMIVKDGKGWGTVHQDGYSKSYGWVAIEKASVHNPKYCKKPTDVTYKGSRYFKELKTAQLVEVERVTEVRVNFV